MLSKKELEQQIAELKMDYINLQGDMEKLEQTGHAGSVAQAAERLEKMEKQLAELNKQLAAFYGNIKEGDHIGLVGANGVGKSTLMGIITGQIIHDTGRVEWLPGTHYGRRIKRNHRKNGRGHS
ncbi:hypothetical protein RhiirA1_482930 [Rhizophagus irregularis]|uniref:ABC transporter domain-containing protein n=1 Tax=Rhizophagus irregularis TaxID=588596 RepID=A0A2N0QL84_9GLOM|nr:hypothetical protein RhiirA1_482930 [Rhizophagus irregularis]